MIFFICRNTKIKMRKHCIKSAYGRKKGEKKLKKNNENLTLPGLEPTASGTTGNDRYA